MDLGSNINVAQLTLGGDDDQLWLSGVLKTPIGAQDVNVRKLVLKADDLSVQNVDMELPTLDPCPSGDAGRYNQCLEGAAFAALVHEFLQSRKEGLRLQSTGPGIRAAVFRKNTAIKFRFDRFNYSRGTVYIVGSASIGEDQ